MTDEGKVDLDSLTMEERVKVLRERRAKMGTKPKAPEKPTYEVKDFIDLGDSYDDPQDVVIDGIDIVDAYVRYIGKMTPKVHGSQTESVKISCPMPGHVDSNPSAWVNTEKKVWHCGACETGGDIYDLVAIEMGLYPHYKKTSFPEVKAKLAADYGFVKIKGLKEDYYVPSEPDAKVIPIKPVEIEPEHSKQADVVEELPLSDPASVTHIDWEPLVEKDSFLDTWMRNCTKSTDLPHEYFLWEGLMALGFLGKTSIYLRDNPNVKGNLFVCLYGPTGLGKSKALKPFSDLIYSVLPYNFSDKTEDPDGVKSISMPGSAEALIDSFTAEVQDPVTGKIDHRAQVAGLLKIEEFLSFVNAATRKGSNLKPVFIDFYDAFDGQVSTHSRGAGETIAENPFCQMATTTQPKAIHDYLKRADAESGFLNRLNFIVGNPRQEPEGYGSILIEIEDAKDKFRDLLVWTKAKGKHSYILKDDALDLWLTFFKKEIAPFKKGVKELLSLQARIDLMLKKLMLLFAINAKEDEISMASVEKAIALYPYIMATYEIVSTDLKTSARTSCQEDVIEMMERTTTRTGRGPSKAELAKHFKDRYDREEIINAVETLFKAGELDEHKPSGVGRPTVRYTVAK